MSSQLFRCVAVAIAAATGSLALADTPDFIAEKLTSDGRGYIDTHYCYRRAADTSPKTSKVVLDYYDTDRCGYNNPYTSKTSRRTYFSFWKSDGKGLSHVNYSGTTAQIMGEDWKAVTPTPGSGDASVTLNYATGKGKWGGSGEFSLPAVSAWDMSETMSYYLFAWNYDGVAQSFGVFDLKNFRIYESADNGATETLVRDFVPCYANGRAGVYDRKTGEICPATSDGFVLTGYDISLEAGKSLIVTPVCASPRTLTLAAGSELVFDGHATLVPEAPAVLPAEGTVAVSLTESTGRGRS